MAATLSTFQTAIIEAIHSGNEHIVVDAKAGAGKSFTILEALKTLPSSKRSLLMAFNKSIQIELDEKVAKNRINAEVKTFHSLAYSALRNHMGRGRRIKVNKRKSYFILRDWAKNGTITPEDMKLSKHVLKLVGLAKNSAAGCVVDGVKVPMNEDLMNHLIDHHAICIDGDEDRAIELALLVLEKSAMMKYEIDFDDMLWLPLYLNARFMRADMIFVDELQDTNVLQLEIASRCMGSTGRFVGVGDPYQAIYGFRGADSDAFINIIDRMKAKVLGLPICYRCSLAVIEEAQKIVPDIQAAPNAEQGSVEDLEAFSSEFFTEAGINAILCRNNAPTVKMCYGLIRRRIPAYILGRTLSRQLCAIIDQMEALTLDDLKNKIDVYYSTHLEKAREKNHTSKIATLEDQWQCFAVFFDMMPAESRTIAGLKRQIESLFSDKNKDGICLSSIHKSKGKEWKNVAILDVHLMPSKYAVQPWQQQQERNLHYVAITRAKTNLFYITSDGWM